MAKMTTREMRSEIGNHLSEAEELTVKYLRACGWRYTCSTPGSYWIWMRDVPPEIGRHITVAMFGNAREALAFQDRLTAEQWPLGEGYDAALAASDDL